MFWQAQILYSEGCRYTLIYQKINCWSRKTNFPKSLLSHVTEQLGEQVYFFKTFQKITPREVSPLAYLCNSQRHRCFVTTSQHVAHSVPLQLLRTMLSRVTSEHVHVLCFFNIKRQHAFLVISSNQNLRTFEKTKRFLNLP